MWDERDHVPLPCRDMANFDNFNLRRSIMKDNEICQDWYILSIVHVHNAAGRTSNIQAPGLGSGVWGLGFDCWSLCRRPGALGLGLEATVDSKSRPACGNPMQPTPMQPT